MVMEKSLRKYFPLFALPGIVCFLIAFLIPMIMGLYLSFCEFTNVPNAQWVGLDNYVKAFTLDNYFNSALWLTVKFTIVSVLSINLFAFGLALILTKGVAGTNVFRTIFFMPNLIGGIVL